MGLPEEFHRRAEALVRGDTEAWQPSPAVPAATIILIRDGDSGLEVFLQQRVGSMKFAAGMFVFPGGRVEESDRAGTVPWQPGARSEPFVLPPRPSPMDHFEAISIAAMRETWEEAAVVLASQDRPGPGADLALSQWLRSEGLSLDAGLVQPWIHWVTPEVERRRYDTRFLVAEVPDRQTARDLGVESRMSTWAGVAAAIEAARSGEMPMLPPTVDALEQLGAFDTAAAVMLEASGRTPQPKMPVPVLRDDQVAWRIRDPYDDTDLGAW